MKRTAKSKLVLTTVMLLVVSLGVFVMWKRGRASVEAVDVGTSVTVSNTGPDFKGGTNVYETPASTAADPTNEDAEDVVIKATSEDSNDDNYFLIVCSTDSVTAGGGDGNAPACGATEYCISTSTLDETEATCTVDTSSGFDTNEVYAWYAFVCDDVTATACSSSSQGTLSDGSESPFEINHRPEYTTFSDGGCANPGSNVTFTASNGASPLDDDEGDGGTQDVVDLYVCKADDFTGSACGAGGTWCSQTGVAGTNTSIACDYTVPSVWDDDPTRNAYAFVMDTTGFEASSQLSDTWNACNVDPTVSSVTLNSGANMTLTAPGPTGTTDFTLTASVTDNNGCTDISTVEAFLYRSAVTYAGCSASDPNNCYPNISCSLDSGTDDCTHVDDSAPDATAAYTCTASVYYHADPTDGSVAADSTWYDQNWLDTILATDDDAATGNTEVTTGVEMVSYTAFTVTSSIDYGTLAAGANSDTTNQTTTTTATGNVGLDENLSGTTMTYSTYEIPIANQKYSLGAFDYDSAGTALSASATESELNCAKTTTTGSPATADVYWGIAIPAVAGAGSYTGTDYIVAIKGEAGDW